MKSATERTDTTNKRVFFANEYNMESDRPKEVQIPTLQLRLAITNITL